MQFDPAAARAMTTRVLHAPAPRRRSPWMALLAAVLDLAEGKAELLRHGERAWASATFTGSRHTLALTFSGEDGIAAADRFITALPDHEFAIPGQVVADAAIVAVSEETLPAHRIGVEVELLLLDDC